MRLHSVKTLAYLTLSMACTAPVVSAQPVPSLLGTLRTGSSAAFRIASPMQVGNAAAFQTYNDVVNHFPAPARIVERHLSALFFRVEQGAVLVEGTLQGMPLPAHVELQPDGRLRIGVELQSSTSTLSLEVIVANDQIAGSYFYSSGLIIHGPENSVMSSSSSSYGGNFRSTLVPIPPEALPPPPPVNLEVDNELQHGRVVLRWQPGANPARSRGYIVYRQIDIMGERVRLGMVKEPYFVDSSDDLRNLPLVTSLVYSVAAVGVNGQESSATWVQIITPAFVPY